MLRLNANKTMTDLTRSFTGSVSTWEFTPACGVSLWVVVERRAGGAAGVGNVHVKYKNYAACNFVPSAVTTFMPAQ